ncbi:dolichyl-diphosphooligosaccharide--protein glycosyltransferase subunit [Blastocystis sp. subtype 4]|uniref:dolichyl-diphosphooligosaccharide--protein glycosyltransferase subunit n=1 Tax=Blastocystis sp. subtype 4 TaxID=944170 RepID=UPI000711C9D5|nr:dolichyl-diphosphooligosaccharide--protein glycosyltransferase subunit [Blastocystis sp. subtype 4]KNB42178.1 dolichyl-diphosphooligosaccharide--protein glycosyltransferase subunit [Blastocystis sp. subtype 4]|eukprot:XP_014525621.1 dolichyl-diphosphooligosaccharide--protein glycosyltransferase subunit [Blastocystis sp. subtype 4]
MAPITTKTKKVEQDENAGLMTPVSYAQADLSCKDECDDAFSPVLRYSILGLICLVSFLIRLFAVVRYESVIHEYDPWFNYRATKFLAWSGPYEFLNWMDDRSWYPLGRIVGGTAYPGLMGTSYVFHKILNMLHFTIQVRNMCVFIAPIFAAATAIASYLLTYEATRRTNTALLASAFVGLVPSYISRSVGGSYDNEAVAIFALIFTFYLWVKSVNTGSLFISACCALSYFYMVASWGGYVFIINIIPIYVVLMVLIRRYSHRLYIAYSTFYILGSILAMQIPFVGFNVVKQAECIISHGVFIGLQCYALLVFAYGQLPKKYYRRLLVGIFAFVVTVVILLVLIQVLGITRWTGRSLTLLDPTYATKYIPIIASVSEHQPTTWTTFFLDLQIMVPLAPVGIYLLFKEMSDANIFLILYGTISWYFAGMFASPIACILAAEGFSALIRRFMAYLRYHDQEVEINGEKKKVTHVGMPALAGVLAVVFAMFVFYTIHCTFISSEAYSSPSIVIATTNRDGTRTILDDYREAYYWMRQNTDEHAKFLSWWDYGYQMAGMGNRTVIVDNNTWNNTHIATVGRALASSEDKAYPIIRSLDVDYVLVIFGGFVGYSGDDINKFLWMIRIASGVYPDEVQEANFFNAGQYRIDDEASPTMRNSLLYRLSYYRFSEVRLSYQHPAGYDMNRHAVVGEKNIQLKYFEEAFTSEHWIVRIYRVKNQATTEPTISYLTKRSSEASHTASDEYRFVGCTTSEATFSSDKVYAGGTTGASYALAREVAIANNKKYFAVAKVGSDGHVFAFNRLLRSLNPKDNEGGCERRCEDNVEMFCGCADNACTGLLPSGEEFNRRWAIYELKSAKKAGKGRRGKKSKAQN